MTDATLTPEIYGDFGLFLDQMGVRRKQKPVAEETVPEKTEEPREDPNAWHKEGKECPF